jgi:riboflavin synthase
MFTGIIDHCGTIIQIDPQRIQIECAFQQLELGESIAIDGICLTIDGIQGSLFSSDISPETMAVTTARQFKPLQKVNLERALQPSSRLGGHFVLGHVDQVAHLVLIRPEGEFIEMQFSGLDKKYLISKGSIAINGVSLTINALTENGFSVMLIPHTLERTNLSVLHINDVVNIEFDMMAKMVVEQCQRYLYPLKTP